MDNKKQERGKKEMNNIIFLGKPGSGKGTYSTRVAEKLGIPHISTGDILRENINSKTKLGKEVEEIVNEGKLVPDEIVNKIVEERLKREDCKKGFILDGYPRTMEQAKTLEGYKKVNKVLNIDVPDEVVIRRITTRRICKKCGAVYNLLTSPPKKEGICDKCSGELYQRKDDTEEEVKIRLKEYEKLTKPLIEYYNKKGVLKTVKYDKKLIPKGEIDIPIESMLQKILNILEQQ